jgi:hypothetical protein
MRNLAFAPIIVLYLWAMGSYAQQSNPGLRNGDEVRPEISVLPLSGSTVTDLHLRPRFTTTIRLPEPVTSVAVGAPTIFEVEHSDQEPDWCLSSRARRMQRRATSLSRSNRSMPTLTGGEKPYHVPPSDPAPLMYRGLPLDRIEDLLPSSGAWKQAEPFLVPKEEVTGGRPITPLHAGHVGLLCTAGLLNGVFGEGSERHIARWRTVKTVTVFEVKEKGFTEIHKRERFTNELALVYEDGRTLVLGEEKKKEDSDAERIPAIGAA